MLILLQSFNNYIYFACLFFRLFLAGYSLMKIFHYNGGLVACAS